MIAPLMRRLKSNMCVGAMLGHLSGRYRMMDAIQELLLM